MARDGESCWLDRDHRTEKEGSLADAIDGLAARPDRNRNDFAASEKQRGRLSDFPENLLSAANRQLCTDPRF